MLREAPRITITEKELRKCFRFANKQYTESGSSLDYALRGQNDPETIIRQIAAGKAAEIAVHRWLTEHYRHEVTPPDFKVLGPRRKSYTADLSSDLHKFHVKTQIEEVGQKLGVSWIFQREDPLVTTPTDRDIIVLTTISDDLLTVKIRVITMAKVVAGMYDDLRAKRLSKTKCALYAERLKAEGIRVA